MSGRGGTQTEPSLAPFELDIHGLIDDFVFQVIRHGRQPTFDEFRGLWERRDFGLVHECCPRACRPWTYVQQLFLTALNRLVLPSPLPPLEDDEAADPGAAPHEPQQEPPASPGHDTDAHVDGDLAAAWEALGGDGLAAEEPAEDAGARGEHPPRRAPPSDADQAEPSGSDGGAAAAPDGPVLEDAHADPPETDALVPWEPDMAVESVAVDQVGALFCVYALYMTQQAGRGAGAGQRSPRVRIYAAQQHVAVLAHLARWGSYYSADCLDVLRKLDAEHAFVYGAVWVDQSSGAGGQPQPQPWEALRRKRGRRRVAEDQVPGVLRHIEHHALKVPAELNELGILSETYALSRERARNAVTAEDLGGCALALNMSTFFATDASTKLYHSRNKMLRVLAFGRARSAPAPPPPKNLRAHRKRRRADHEHGSDLDDDDDADSRDERAGAGPSGPGARPARPPPREDVVAEDMPALFPARGRRREEIPREDLEPLPDLQHPLSPLGDLDDQGEWSSGGSGDFWMGGPAGSDGAPEWNYEASDDDEGDD
ncbi:unnamed protein product [Pedinophyceae sp. YPF-701]|nr:unnamed protein product [Pedinophyceae sp. YPF-701]